ncbi:GAF domain-containing protein [Paenibacillus sp. L3-i20]|uniref:GAF domain-containing protein n=1 Tax=Paenibacillus sp. L3-i20 TaxID=2905833 RepID=UPI001EDD289B|nr:GAF domain-containing protein [Paenibacillus sp. L3-i20]GKU78851.1 hypothetical protein L3i20_v232480 [Paenibacillus sp. L3-i20]
MNGPKELERLTVVLGLILSKSKSDYAALAMPADHYRKMKWNISMGSRNDRVGQMKLRPGIGIGGMVLRHGAVFRVNENENKGMLTECPVMLAEKLASGIAFPIIAPVPTYRNGILILGRRNNQFYDEQEIEMVQSLLPNLIEMMGAEAL